MSGTPSAGAPPQPVPLERLLTLYLDPSLTLADIAFTLDLSIAELITLTDAPDFRALVERHAAAHERRAADLCRVGRDLAARTLTRIAETCDNPETARKAAGAVLKLSQPCATGGSPASAPRPCATGGSPASARDGCVQSRSVRPRQSHWLAGSQRLC